MTRRCPFATLALCGAALAAPLAARAGIDLATATYLCERGVQIPASHVTAAEGAVAVLSVEGRQISLVQTPAASGARYAWPGGSGYVWWTKGTAATLSWLDAATGIETVLYAACQSQ